MQSGAYSYTPSGFLPLNEWTHLAATYNTETGVINMYVNGAEVSSERVSASANLNSATCKLIISLLQSFFSVAKYLHILLYSHNK